MQVISSKDNRIIKEAASLSEKKYRDELGLYLIEGPNIVKEAMQEGGRVRFIFTRAGAETEEIRDILTEAEAQDLAAYELTGDVFAKVTHTDNPQSVAAVFEKRQMDQTEFFIKAGSGNIIVLDRLQDPGNVGTILRTAEAFGFTGIILVKGTADVFQPKIVRAAAGSLLRLPLLLVSDAEEAIALIEAHGKKIFTAAMNGRTELMNAGLSENAAVVIGNEGNGADRVFLEKAETLSIPMEGKTESLNAAIAAAAIMYESLRQRRNQK